MKIFIGFNEVAGYFTNLHKGFLEHHVDAQCFFIRDHRFAYGSTGQSKALYLLRKTTTKYCNTPKEKIYTKKFFLLLSLFLAPLHMLPLFIWAVFKFDVFIFESKVTFFKYWDLPILRFFGKKIVVVFLGSDCRPPYIDGALMTSSDQMNTAACIKATKVNKLRVKTVEKYADFIIAGPPTAQFFEKPFVNWFKIGIPYQPVVTPSSQGSKGEENNIRILHSPSSPEAKGSNEIRTAITSLQQRGYSIEFIEIVGKPNAEVLHEINKCDFIVDQLYSDTPMAVFTVEAACLGKPAVVGSYYAEQIADDIPKDSIPPSLFCLPQNIESAIMEMIENNPFRKQLGENAQKFVLQEWNANIVAQRYLTLFSGDFPSDWMTDPYLITYFKGVAASEEKIKIWVNNIVNKEGVKALELNDKPQLQEKLIQFATSISQNNS